MAELEKKHPPEVLQGWCVKILAEGKNITPWERSFTENVHGQLDRNGWISVDQLRVLERIYAEKTS